MKHFFTLLILWFSGYATAHAEALQFNHLTTNEGLSQNTIFDIIQDRRSNVQDFERSPLLGRRIEE